jgi:uncharacterized membrane protein YeiB
MSQQAEPVEATARYVVLDLVRGFAPFGVLMVNLLYFAACTGSELNNALALSRVFASA